MSNLYMVQFFFSPRRLVQMGKMLHLPLRQTTTNYVVHCALGELFGDHAPKPFVVDANPQSVQSAAAQAKADADEHPTRVLGYTDVDGETLQETAKLGASPTVYEVCDWDRMAAKPMPTSLPEGLSLRFELRACPVVRKASAGEVVQDDGTRKTWREGQELDAFLSRAWENPDETLTREGVYRDWLARQFKERGGAVLDADSVRMTRFSIERMTRRTHATGDGERDTETLKRPDVTLTGTLTVTDPDAFTTLLRSGIGRHKAFGYGMLKVRRA